MLDVTNHCRGRSSPDPRSSTAPHHSGRLRGANVPPSCRQTFGRCRSMCPPPTNSSSTASPTDSDNDPASPPPTSTLTKRRHLGDHHNADADTRQVVPSHWRSGGPITLAGDKWPRSGRRVTFGGAAGCGRWTNSATSKNRTSDRRGGERFVAQFGGHSSWVFAIAPNHRLRWLRWVRPIVSSPGPASMWTRSSSRIEMVERLAPCRRRSVRTPRG